MCYASPGESTVLNSTTMNYGGDDVSCHNTRGVDGKPAPICYTEKTLDADGCTWEVQVLGFNYRGGRIVARSDESCEVKNCSGDYSCGPGG